MAANFSSGTSDSQSEIVQSARHLLSLLTSRDAARDVANTDMRDQRQGGHSPAPQPEKPSLQMEMTRSFPGIFTKGRGKRRFPAANLVPAKKIKPLEVAFYLLPKQCERTPNEQEQIDHLQSGLGRRTAHLDEGTTHEELCEALKVLFPKLRMVTGGWLLYKSSGGWGRRKLSLVAPDDIGYTGRILKAASRGGKNLFIAPVQEELSTNPLQLTDEAFSSMSKATCQKCGVEVPLQLLTEHIKSCGTIDISSDDNLPTENMDSSETEERKSMQQCPVCTKMFPCDFIEVHASSCGESAGNVVRHDIIVTEMHDSTVSEEVEAAVPGPSRASATVTDGWLTISDPARAISQCADNFLRIHEMKSPLFLSMDIRKSPTEQDMALISFYKRPNVEWARPLNCRLEGDTAVGQGVTRFYFSRCMEKLKSGFCINFGNSNVTMLFEGEPGHLVPSASHFLVDSDLFIVAGRMLGHSFLHGGPCLSGLSPAVVHVLLGGSPETATVTLEDCPDLEIRETIRLVIGRVTRQIKQLRRGLKETQMWTVLTQRPDTVALLFPKPGADSFSPEELLQRITWPRDEDDDDDDDDDYSGDTKSRMSGYLREFIANATSIELTNLVKFWTGWEILPTSLTVEVVKSRYPTASTCFETLRIPGIYRDYTSFQSDMLACNFYL
ncbi:uncharacterized protein LOC134303178 isoform X2 [Trichomycterus rosablanca]|uniref:uncharacterized protein LOC134303178 isoform X2 n=1 Tax=Trichomycterus rosablanca TaxID=2290929 RepID=UPI002F356E6B